MKTHECAIEAIESKKTDCSIVDVLQRELAYSTEAYETNKALLAQTTVATPDVADTSSQLEQRALAEAAMVRSSLKIGRVKAALKRVEEGSISECADCDSDIPIQRVLFTLSSRCVDCQEVVDAKKQHFA